ncbi:MAG TPA: DUF1559 domain-containing protein, partial [Urbifossiella sp.]
MPISVTCPGCEARLNAPDAAAGKTVKCPKCKAAIQVPAAADSPFEVVDEPEPAPKKAVPVAAKAPAKKKMDIELDDDEEDDKPRAKKKPRHDDGEDEDDDDRPRKKKGKGKGKKKAQSGMSPVVLGAIVGGVLLLAGGGFGIYWFAIREKPKEKETASTTDNGGKNRPRSGSGPAGEDSVHQQSSANLKRIALGFHNFDSVEGGLPAGYFDSTGKLGLSWRVAILPYIEQKALFDQFKLNEPWDSEHNKKLIPRMPRDFAAPNGNSPAGYTFYRTFTGPNTPFPPQQNGTAGKVAKGLGLVKFTDGTSNTAMIVEAAEAV